MSKGSGLQATVTGIIFDGHFSSICPIRFVVSLASPRRGCSYFPARERRKARLGGVALLR